MNPRPFKWDDITRLHALVERRWAVDGPHGQMHIGDFYWTLRGLPARDLLRHLQVWAAHEGDALLAFALLDPPASGELIIAPDTPASLFDEALTWIEAEHRVAGDGDLSILVTAGDDRRAAALQRRGYAPGDTGNVRFWRALESLPEEARLPDGVTLRGVTTEDDLERRAFVECDSFGTSGITADTWRSMTQRLPGYMPELDLIAVAADGTGASACTCWYDAATRCGEFEAVGTAKAHQRLGIGKAVITEGLRRLYRLGAREAVVQTTIGNAPAIALYHSCGFEVVAGDYRWSKRA